MRAFREFRGSATRRLGFGIFRYPLYYSLDADLKRLIESASPITTVIDVGAHDGGFGRRLRRLGYSGQIVSFEPGPIATDLEARTAHDSDWRVVRAALGDTVGEAELFLMAGSDFNSLHSPSSEAGGRFSGRLQVQGSVRVPVWRLEDEFDLHVPPGSSVLLKSDTQGHDLAVLEGCGAKLDEVDAVLVEASAVRLYEGAPLIEEMIAFLRARGFSLVGAFPVSRPDVVVEFDCLFVRPPGRMT